MSLKNILNTVLELLFPQKAPVKKLENMSGEEFRRLCSKSERLGWIQPLFAYRTELVSNAIWELKYRGNERIARLLADLLYEDMVEELSEKALIGNFADPVLVPIPISARRKRQRGFNQCSLLAQKLEEIDRNSAFSVMPLLEKIKETESQTKTIGRAKRLENLRGCFKALPAARGRNIVLLDDVVTTGATLEEARKTLLAAGAKDVMAFTIAH